MKIAVNKAEQWLMPTCKNWMFIVADDLIMTSRLTASDSV